ncbi:c-type cytochrome [Nitratifractor sp.]
MKTSKILIALGALTLWGHTLHAQSSEELFKTKCSMCHVTTPPRDMSKLVAPPIAGALMHVKQRYPSKAEAVDFIVDYVLNPQRSKALCMPQRIEHFGLMPSQKGNVTPEELRTIASWLYDHFPPKGFRGGMGMGRGHGMGRGMMRGGMGRGAQ